MDIKDVTLQHIKKFHLTNLEDWKQIFCVEEDMSANIGWDLVSLLASAVAELNQKEIIDTAAPHGQ